MVEAMSDTVRLDFGADVGPPTETTYSLVSLSEDQIRDLAQGYVPRVVRAMAMSCLDWQDEDERRARRHVPRRKAR
jgi:hypothetical protein